jgi:putative membrane protein
MNRTLAQTIGLAALTAMLTVFVARVDGAPVEREAAGIVAGDSAGPRADSSVTVKWLNDANVLALVGTMNSRQIAAANVLLGAWHSDTVRALATSLLHEHSALQHSADSLAAMLHIVPVAPALTEQVNAAFQAQIDSILGNRGMAFDRAYVQQQIASHQLMADYLSQLSGEVEVAEVRDWIASANGIVAAQLTRIQGQQRALVVRDSIVADSIAKRAAARRKR